MSKLTLSVNEEVVNEAKRYAKVHGVSISALVETYLKAIANPPRTEKDPPMLKALRGKLKPADPDEYGNYLEEKYR